MKCSLLTAALSLLVTLPLSAEEIRETFDIGGDSFLAGREVIFDRAGQDNLFAAGEIVRGEADIAGSAHLAGRKVTMIGAVGGNAYLAGMDVALEGPVTGDATLAGYDVSVAEVGGNLRISGGTLSVLGPVSGYALISGETVRIDGKIAGDAIITARDLTFENNARMDGKLTLFEEEIGTLEVPENVAEKDQIVRRDISEWDDVTKDMRPWNWRSILVDFVKGVIIVAVLASFIAAIAPRKLADLRRNMLERPFRNLLYGFLTQAAFIGAAVLLLVIVIGSIHGVAAVFAALIASAATILFALIVGFAGYVVAAYAFGVSLLLAAGRAAPEAFGTRALAAGIGAVAVGIVALIPVVGWLFVMSLVLIGIGAIILKTLRPAFFVQPM